MRKLLPLVLLLLAGCAAHNTPVQPPSPLIDHTITLKWNQSFVNNPACSSTVTSSCYTGFEEGTAIGTTLTKLHTDTPAVCSGTTQPESCTTTFNAQIPIGAVTFYVEADYLDQNGTAQVTTATSSSSVQVAADAPSGLTASVQ